MVRIPAEKMPLVHAVRRVRRAHRSGGEIDGRAHCSDSANRRARTEFAGEFQYQVAAHGVADQRDTLEAEFFV